MRNLVGSSTDAPPRKPTVPFLMILFAGAAALFVGVRLYRKFQDRRHPAVEEHRDELLEAAAKALNCPGERVAVQVREPTLAGVAGCGKSLTFRWGTVLNRTSPRRSTTPFWHDIDPDCRIDYMGCGLPCE